MKYGVRKIAGNSLKVNKLLTTPIAKRKHHKVQKKQAKYTEAVTFAYKHSISIKKTYNKTKRKNYEFFRTRAKRHYNAVIIQRRSRVFLAVNLLQRMKVEAAIKSASAIMIQTQLRRHLASKELDRLKLAATKVASAIKIQSQIRRCIASRIARKLFRIVQIQSQFRRYLTIRRVRRLRIIAEKNRFLAPTRSSRRNARTKFIQPTAAQVRKQMQQRELEKKQSMQNFRKFAAARSQPQPVKRTRRPMTVRSGSFQSKHPTRAVNAGTTGPTRTPIKSTAAWRGKIQPAPAMQHRATKKTY